MKSSLSLSLAALAGLATTSDATTPVATSLMHSIHQASDQYANLGDLVPTTKSVGWDGYWTDRSWYQAGFIINSETFATGVFAHAPSQIMYDIEMKYATFSGAVGLEDGDAAFVCPNGIDWEVIGDGAVLQSGSIGKNEAAATFNVDVKTVRNLELKAHAKGDDATKCDHVAWVNPKLFEDPIVDCMEISALAPTSRSVGWGSYWTDEKWNNGGFLIGGTQYSNGVYAHIPSHLQYNLGGVYATIEACAGIDDHTDAATCTAGNSGSGTFTAQTDAATIASFARTAGQAAHCFESSVESSGALTLRVEGATDCGHAEWVNARVCKILPGASTPCELSGWSAWSGCSATCGTGYEHRTRQIVQQPGVSGTKCGTKDEVQTCNTAPCPVDCLFSAWSISTTCTKSCGTGGTRTHTRSISRQAMNGGTACPITSEVESCMNVPCPVPCLVTGWSDIAHSTCTVTCGSGTKRQTRSVTQMPQHNGAACPDLTLDTACTGISACPVDCAVNDWGGWGTCTANCGGGTQTRTRAITVAADAGGAACPTATQSQSCNTQNCPINCQTTDTHGAGKAWSVCTQTCGGGTQTQYRSITVNAAYGGTACPDLTVTQNCYDNAVCQTGSPPAYCSECPVDCTYTQFGLYSECSASCGLGKQWRGRTMLAAETFGGAVCPHMEEERPCNAHACPIDCVVESYGGWTSCSKSCGDSAGVQTRARSMTSDQSFGGKACPGTMESRACAVDACPVDCDQGDWVTTTSCTKTCGTGWMTQTRTTHTYESNGGTPCGAPTQTIACSVAPCEVDCLMSGWTDVILCSKPCGGGKKTERRTILREAEHGGTACGALENDDVSCNNQACPINCEMTTWSVWSECSKTCGSVDGSTFRMRHVHIQDNGAANGATVLCADQDTSAEQACNLGACPTDCTIGTWGAYTGCDAVCGAGTKQRTRSVTGTDCGAASATEDVVCNDVPCPGDCQQDAYAVPNGQAAQSDGWSTCSATCGGAFKSKTAAINTAATYGGVACLPTKIFEVCQEGVDDNYTDECEVDCLYTAYVATGDCSASCGIGQQTYTRSIIRDSAHGGDACNELSHTADCNTDACVVDCEVSAWSSWSTCDKACNDGTGAGTQVRNRNIDAATVGLGGAACTTDLQQTVACNSFACAVDCVVESTWHAGVCSRTCGGTGLVTSTRSVTTHSANGGAACPPTIKTDECSTGDCPVHCEEGTWSDWLPAVCPVACGVSLQTKTRPILQTDLHNGRVCLATKEDRQCEVSGVAIPTNCPVDCVWGAWGYNGVADAWGWNAVADGCSATCGTGQQEQTRTEAVSAAYLGAACTGALSRSQPCNEQACALDCSWHDYSPTDAEVAADPAAYCSAACGGGVIHQVRTVDTVGNVEGTVCQDSDLVKETTCNSQDCPVDCLIGSWSLFTPCTKSCGTGTQQRVRSLTAGNSAGTACPTSPAETDTRDCAEWLCPVECDMSAWGYNGVAGAWSQCSKSCNGGVQTSTRTVVTPAANGAAPCPSNVNMNQNCELQACPINCEVSAYGDFGDCTLGCGSGARYHYRTVTVAPMHGGTACPILREAHADACNVHACPTHCVVGNWDDWESCSRSCGNGIMLRNRQITQAAVGGNACPATQEARVCAIQNCPVDCVETPYTSPTACTKTCGGGFKWSYRQISQQALWGGKPCDSAGLVLEEFCNQQACPTDCDVGAWSWGSSVCTKSCKTAGVAAGTRTRTRTNVAETNGGVACPTSPAETETVDCNTDIVCPSDCQMSAWGYEDVGGTWIAGGESQCTKSCGGGTKRQTKTIIALPFAGGAPCTALVQTVPCSLNACAIHCTVTDWTAWGACSTSCGAGISKRHRNVHTHAAHGGYTCPALDETKACMPEPCAIDCVLSDWTGFGSCSATCGGGKKVNTRSLVTAPQFGGMKCGAVENIQGCSTAPCPIDCALGDWTPYSACTTSCGGGLKSRTLRILHTASYGGKPCPTQACDAPDATGTHPECAIKQTIACAADACPVHCQVTAWSPVTACDVTCSTVYDRVKTGSQLAQHGWQSRTRTVDTPMANNGHGCPATKEMIRCNQYHDCMTLFVDGTQTSTREGSVDAHAAAVAAAAAIATGTHSDTLTVASSANVQHDARVAGSSAPTAAPTKSPFGSANAGCTNGAANVVDGWHGAGAGADYCNLCKCTNGLLSCQKKNCAAPTQGKVCSHVSCEFKYSYEATHMILMVNSNHQELNGASHHCQYNVNTDDCACNCFGSGFALTGLSSMVHHVSE